MRKFTVWRRRAIFLFIGTVVVNMLYLLKSNKILRSPVSSVILAASSLQDIKHTRANTITTEPNHNEKKRTRAKTILTEPNQNTTNPNHTNTTVATVPQTEKVVNPHDFKMLLNPPNACPANSDIELVMCVPIARNNVDGRRVISETWGSYADNIENKAVLVFFLGNGHANESPDIQKTIQIESQTFNYIVQEDYVDSYQNLSLKSVSILKWVTTYCPQAKYVLKIDDDIYANIPKLMTWLRDRSKERTDYITGHLVANGSPHRNNNSKWYVNKSQYPGVRYPAFTSGTTYAMPVSTAKRLYLASLQTPLFWLEDVYITGLCRSRKSVKIINCPAIITWRLPATGCHFKNRITGHGYSGREKIKIHRELYDPHLKC